jgi:exodeoxyribonuclease VII large subunit
MARIKREVIERLTKEGLIHLNRQIPLPLVLQRIAVISSATAAGYGDFINHIDGNPYGYKIFHTLFQSLLQGHGAESSIISALREIGRGRRHFDAVVIIRGGGSQIDLSCFDAYRLAAEVAKSPLPVITGIGHERDDTVADLVAHTKLKTPTAVAEFLLSSMISFEQRLIEAQAIVKDRSENLIRDENNRLQYVAQHFRHIMKNRFSEELNRLGIGLHTLIHGTAQIAESHHNRLILSLRRITGGLNMCFQQQEHRIRHCGQAVRLLDPINVMKRGYSITYLNEKALKDSTDAQEGDIIKTKVYKGSVTSRVEALNVEE